MNLIANKIVILFIFIGIGIGIVSIMFFTKNDDTGNSSTSNKDGTTRVDIENVKEEQLAPNTNEFDSKNTSTTNYLHSQQINSLKYALEDAIKELDEIKSEIDKNYQKYADDLSEINAEIKTDKELPYSQATEHLLHKEKLDQFSIYIDKLKTDSRLLSENNIKKEEQVMKMQSALEEVSSKLKEARMELKNIKKMKDGATDEIKQLRAENNRLKERNSDNKPKPGDYKFNITSEWK